MTIVMQAMLQTWYHSFYIAVWGGRVGGIPSLTFPLVSPAHIYLLELLKAREGRGNTFSYLSTGISCTYILVRAPEYCTARFWYIDLKCTEL